MGNRFSFTASSACNEAAGYKMSKKKYILSLDDLKKMEHGKLCEIFNMSDSRLCEISQFFSHYFIPVLVYKVEHALESPEKIKVKFFFEIKKDEEFVHTPLFPTTQRKT